MLFDEDYSISRPLTGDAKIKKLVLTGWSNAPTKLEAGRIYWVINTSNVLQLYTTEANADADASEIASGTISSGLVTLAQANSSGISGTAYVSHTAGTASTGNIIVTYAFEDDLKIELSNVTSLLDGSSLWEGGTRFETALKRAKRELDQMILGQVGTGSLNRSDGKPDLTLIAEPGQLRVVHAKLTCSVLMMNRAAFSPEALDIAGQYRDDAMRLLKGMHITIDTENDDIVDGFQNMSSPRLSRW